MFSLQFSCSNTIVKRCVLLDCRLGESASQSGSDDMLRKTLRTAASYIAELEKKLQHLDEVQAVHGDCPLAASLAEDVEKIVVEQAVAEEAESQVASSRGSSSSSGKKHNSSSSSSKDGDCAGWHWHEGKWYPCDEQEDDGDWEGEWEDDWEDDCAWGNGEDWTEDAQPPSDRLKAAAAASSLAPSPASVAPNLAIAHTREPPSKMNSTTHRAEWMKMAA